MILKLITSEINRYIDFKKNINTVSNTVIQFLKLTHLRTNKNIFIDQKVIESVARFLLIVKFKNIVTMQIISFLTDKKHLHFPIKAKIDQNYCQ